MKKLCSRCGQEKELDHFQKLSSTKDGLNRNCKSCRSEICQRYKKSEKGKATKKLNLIKEMQQNRDRANLYYKNNRSHVLAKVKIYRQENINKTREKVRECNKKRRAEHRPDDRVANNIRVKKRYRLDLRFRLRCLVSQRMSFVLAKIKNEKLCSSIDYLGCSIGDFKKYIESQFDERMNWDNYGKNRGKWHIDHKIPLCLFDLSRESCRKLAFNFSNLQPLWAEQNWAKGGRYVS